MDTVKPGRYLPKAFEKCGLFPINPDKPMERIPSRHMPLDRESTRALLNATFGEKLEQLRGVGPNQKTKRGKKVPPGKSYCQEEETEETEDEDDVDVDELLDDGDEAEMRSKKKRCSVETDDEESDNQQEFEEQDVAVAVKSSPTYPVGSYVVATYDDEWYIALVEGEEPDEETPGFTMLKYMERRGRNSFVWGTTRDTLKTNNRDIVRAVDPPIPVSSRLFGLPKDVLKDIEMFMSLKWVVYYFFFLSLILSSSSQPVLSLSTIGW